MNEDQAASRATDPADRSWSDPSDQHHRGIGVGPWPGGKASWPTDARYDPTLLEEGDRRNVVDAYRYWRLDAIVADLDLRRHGFHIGIENMGHDFNIGSIVRTANAFLAAQIHIIGRRRWNKRGAMVTDRYQHVRHHEDATGFAAWVSTAGTESAASSTSAVRSAGTPSALPIIGIDNVPGSTPLEHATLPRDCVMFFGSESEGLSAEAQASCEAIYDIAQFGSTRSINAGAAAAIAMHAWIVQHGEISN